MALLRKDMEFPLLTRLIRGYGYNSVSLCEVLGCSQPTAQKKLNDPKLFTLADIYALSTKGNIPIDKIKKAIR